LISEERVSLHVISRRHIK